MGVLSGFLAGTGEQFIDIANKKQAKYDAEDLGKQRIQLELEREKRSEEAGIRRDGRSEQADIRREVRGVKTRAEERGLINAQKYNPENVKLEIDREQQAKLAGGKTQVEIDRLKRQSESTPEALKSVRDLARAKDIDHGAGLRGIQIETARLSLNEKKKVNSLLDEAETTKDPARRDAIIQSLTVRGVIKPGSEYDTEKVTTETISDDGSTSKTERTQKRQVGAAKAGVTPRSEYEKMPVGARYTGPDGKTYIKGK